MENKPVPIYFNRHFTDYRMKWRDTIVNHLRRVIEENSQWNVHVDVVCATNILASVFDGPGAELLCQ